MGQYIINLTEEEEEVCLTDMADVGVWIENAIRNKIRQLQDAIVEQSGEGSKFTPLEKKLQIIQNLIAQNSLLLKSAVERTEKL